MAKVPLDRETVREALGELLVRVLQWEERQAAVAPPGVALPSDVPTKLDDDKYLQGLVENLVTRRRARELHLKQAGLAGIIVDANRVGRRFLDELARTKSEPKQSELIAASSKDLMLVVQSKPVPLFTVPSVNPSWAEAALRGLANAKLALGDGVDLKERDDRVRRALSPVFKKHCSDNNLGSWSSVNSIVNVLLRGTAKDKSAVQSEEHLDFLLTTASVANTSHCG